MNVHTYNSNDFVELYLLKMVTDASVWGINCFRFQKSFDILYTYILVYINI